MHLQRAPPGRGRGRRLARGSAGGCGEGARAVRAVPRRSRPLSRCSPRSCSVPCCRAHRGECGPGGPGGAGAGPGLTRVCPQSAARRIPRGSGSGRRPGRAPPRPRRAPHTAPGAWRTSWARRASRTASRCRNSSSWVMWGWRGSCRASRNKIPAVLHGAAAYPGPKS